jgi:hypothetical protein
MLSSWRMYEMHLALFLKAGCDIPQAAAMAHPTPTARALGCLVWTGVQAGTPPII